MRQQTLLRGQSPPGPKVQTQTSESSPRALADVYVDLTGLTFYSRQPSIPVFVSKKLYPPQTTYSLASTQKFFSSIQLNFSSKECDPTSVYTLLYMICICLLRAIARP